VVPPVRGCGDLGADQRAGHRGDEVDARAAAADLARGPFEGVRTSRRDEPKAVFQPDDAGHTGGGELALAEPQGHVWLDTPRAPQLGQRDLQREERRLWRGGRPAQPGVAGAEFGAVAARARKGVAAVECRAEDGLRGA
jgi:hypothetical protein